MTYGGDLAVLGMHPDEHEALDARTAAAPRLHGRQWKIAGTISRLRQTSQGGRGLSRLSRGNAPKDGTSLLTLSNHEDLHDARRFA